MTARAATNREAIRAWQIQKVILRSTILSANPHCTVPASPLHDVTDFPPIS